MITPNLFLNAATDDEMIQKAVNKANKKKTYVNIPKYNKRTNSNIWIITKAILLNSNSKIILNGCHLRMADNVFTNMFKNSNCDYYGDVLDKRQRNIKIISLSLPLNYFYKQILQTKPKAEIIEHTKKHHFKAI